MTKRTYVMAGGGSGGHLYPGIAVADAIGRLDNDAHIVFFTTERQIDRRIMVATHYDVVAQPIIPVPRQVTRLWDFIRRWRKSVGLCRDFLKEHPNTVVLGLGGFASGPMLRSAHRAKRPTGMLNPDAVPGKANRLGSSYADKIFLQWEESAGFFGQKQEKCVVTGCPIRLAFEQRANSTQKKQFREMLQLTPQRRILVVMGGSQGGRNVNNAFLAVLRRDGELTKTLARQWHIFHIAGTDDEGDVRKAYQEFPGIAVTVVGFNPHMVELLNVTDLLIGRSGASTLAELTATAVPSILLPYPYHKDQHQRMNAEIMYAYGAAHFTVDEKDAEKTAISLGKRLDEVIMDPEPLERMCHGCQELARPDAAAQVAHYLTTMTAS